MCSIYLTLFRYHGMLLALGTNLKEVWDQSFDSKSPPFKNFTKQLYSFVIDYILCFCTGEGKFYVYLWNFLNDSQPGHFVSILNGVVISDEPVSKHVKKARTLTLAPTEACKKKFLNYIGLKANTACALYRVTPKRMRVEKRKLTPIS